MVDTKNIIVVGDKILIQPEENLEKTTSGLYLPPGVGMKEKVQGGYVIKAGPGYPIASPNDDELWKDKEDTKYISLQARDGDFALFLRKDAIEIELEKRKMVIVPQSALLLLIRDDNLLD